MQASGIAGLFTLLFFPCMRRQNGTHKKREKDGTLTLGGHHLMVEYNNQPKVGVGEGLEGGKTVCWVIMKGWDIFPSFGG
jgi:hypothetical protein